MYFVRAGFSAGKFTTKVVDMAGFSAGNLAIKVVHIMLSPYYYEMVLSNSSPNSCSLDYET